NSFVINQNFQHVMQFPHLITKGSHKLFGHTRVQVRERDTDAATSKRGGLVYVVLGLDSLQLARCDLVAGGFTQVASQFNALEAVAPQPSRLSSYPLDPTQGPRAVMPCAHALLRRQVHGYSSAVFM